MKKIGGEPFPENKAIQDMKTIYGPSKNNPPNRKQFMQLPKPLEPPKETMKTAKYILLENIPKDCWWEEMENLTNTPVEYVTKAMESFADQRVNEDRESRWISLENELPQVPVSVYMEMLGNPSRTHAVIATDGDKVWIALHGGDPGIWRMHNPTATHFQELPSPPTNKG